jgi:hypothetical protein
VRTIRYPFEPFAHRVWELRDNLTVHDAWHVALAEWLGVEFVTADERLARASGRAARSAPLVAAGTIPARRLDLPAAVPAALSPKLVGSSNLDAMDYPAEYVDTESRRPLHQEGSRSDSLFLLPRMAR